MKSEHIHYWLIRRWATKRLMAIAFGQKPPKIGTFLEMPNGGGMEEWFQAESLSLFTDDDGEKYDEMTYVGIDSGDIRKIYFTKEG